MEYKVLLDELADLRRQLAEKDKALIRFVRLESFLAHKPTCNKALISSCHFNELCNCGLEAALEAE